MRQIRELGREVTAFSTAALAVTTLAACGLGKPPGPPPQSKGWDVTPTVVGPPQYLSDGRRELTLDSPRRNKDGMHTVIETCLNSTTIVRYDPEIEFLDKSIGTVFQVYIPPQQRIAGPQVEAACVDGELEPGDPVAPVTGLPN